MAVTVLQHNLDAGDNFVMLNCVLTVC